jgi:hypothetical protein
LIAAARKFVRQRQAAPMMRLHQNPECHFFDRWTGLGDFLSSKRLILALLEKGVQLCSQGQHDAEQSRRQETSSPNLKVCSVWVVSNQMGDRNE